VSAPLPFSPAYLLALGFTLLVEVPIVAAFYPGRRLRMALVCAAATAATHALNFAWPGWACGALGMWGGEVFATVSEATAYALAGRQVGKGLFASAAANGLSFGLGALLLR
jgi:hypothetical protein